MRPTARLYLDDGDLLRTPATVIAVGDDAVAFDRTCFYPGGGGQPPDAGVATMGQAESPGVDDSGAATALEITTVRGDREGVFWHVTSEPPQADLLGRPADLQVDARRRRALTRAHTALHVLDTIALRDYGAWITGVQIGAEQSRIDLTLAVFSPELVADLEAKTNAVLAADHPVRTTYLPESEFREREDLLRTLEARPPVLDGRVRVVTIVGFDAQACGGTHVHSTAEVGRLVVVRTENKGRQNKRLYVRVEPPARVGAPRTECR